MNNFTPILTLPLADFLERPRQSRDKRERKKRGSPKEADMRNQEMELLAHLMRRAGFGATRDELEEYVAKGYAAVVDDLLHPERFPEVEEDVVCLYYSLGTLMEDSPTVWQGRWMYRMINTKRPLQEKMALFWHGVFATGW